MKPSGFGSFIADDSRSITRITDYKLLTNLKTRFAEKLLKNGCMSKPTQDRAPRTFTVSVLTRHTSDSKQRKNPQSKNCDCRKQLYLSEHGQVRYVSAKPRPLNQAEKLARKQMDARDPEKIALRKVEKREAEKLQLRKRTQCLVDADAADPQC